MSHHSSSVNGEGTSHKDALSIILDELSSLKLCKEKKERKEKGKKRVEEICPSNWIPLHPVEQNRSDIELLLKSC